MKTLELTISVKSYSADDRFDITNLISEVPGVVVLGGESGYAIDVVVPAAFEATLRDKVEATCDVEPSQVYSYLTTQR